MVGVQHIPPGQYHVPAHACVLACGGMAPTSRAEFSPDVSAGAPMHLLLVVLTGKDAHAERVRHLLLESPSFERGLVSMLDTWLDVLLRREDVSLAAGHLDRAQSTHARNTVDTCLVP
jgi:hypothetical protein